ncbi:AraC family transcriptional regulator [Paenibacillus sp. p3-SID867]|uniref:AraC family transcriptional regulator n=1 Tax=Paenibacillus sp. p3-SID867 TaxID=2916363 RepID=UPI0021A51842|nr:AraC family transcriptional regulator [Paenibacillus sp. p3-SID867]MCT1400542.1 AraC family transcriptional regulator [Paenibacillus sp. p3-SID867]
MKRMFEAVVFGGAKLFWDYRHRNTDQYKGYYHWHQCCEMLFVHEGTGHVVVGGETFPIRRGMLFFFRPYQLHHVYANVSPEQPYTRTIFHFDSQLADELLRPFARRHGLFAALWQGSHPIQAFDLKTAEETVERNLDDYDRTRQEGKGEDAEEIGMLILRLLDTVIRYDPSGQSRTPGILERKSTGYVQQAMRWIDEHYQETFYLDDLADAMHLSKFYLSKLFHEETGSTLKEYVTAKRMRQACRLLETTAKSVEWIGSEVGISNPSYFVQVFKHEVGTTPLKYRTGFIHSVHGKGKAR